nr:glycosyl hydrolase family 8 [Stenotrophomonas maltophilia]
MIDHSHADQRSTSEGQSYALFFALVGNDQALFDRMLGWTQDNLAGGDMRQNLPAWLWGRDDKGGWRVLDGNPAPIPICGWPMCCLRARACGGARRCRDRRRHAAAGACQGDRAAGLPGPHADARAAGIHQG